MSRLLLLVPTLAFVFACGDGGVPLDTSEDPDPTPTNPGHEVPNSDQGSLVLFIEPPNSTSTSTQVTLGGIFAESTRGYVNIVQCLSNPEALCVRQLPTEPDTYVLADRLDPSLRDQIRPIDVGATVNLGPYSAPKFDSNGLQVYYGTQQSFSPPAGETLELSFGPGEWGDAFHAANVVAIPSPIELQGLTATSGQLFTSSIPLELRWTPGEYGDVYLSVITSSERRFYLLEDDGEFIFDFADLNLNSMQSVSLILSRWIQEEVDVDGHTVQVMVQHDQWIRGEYRDMEGRLPLPTQPNTCSEADDAVPITPGRYWGNLALNTNNLSPPSGGCTGWTANGAEAIFAYDMEPFEILTVRETVLGGDASLYLLSTCTNTNTCLAGSDSTYSGGTEEVTWYNDSEEPRRIYIVADTWSGSGLLELDIESMVVLPDMLAESCMEAMDLGPQGTGFYVGDLSGYSNILNPPCAEAPGGEGLMQVHLEPEQTLSAHVRMTGTPSNPALYLLYSCSVLESCVAADTGTGRTASIQYFNESGATEYLYLVVDSNNNSGEYELELSIY